MQAVSGIAVLLFLWAGYVGLLAIVPWQFPPDPDLPNVAARLGYNIEIAYILIAGWTVIGALAIAMLSNVLPVDRGPAVKAGRVPHWQRSSVLLWFERAVVTGVALVLYWPDSHARMGEFIEDSYFLAAMWKMVCGGIPYQDFEFLCGPLTLFPLQFAHTSESMSLSGYFTVYAVSQAALYFVICVIVQKYIVGIWARYLAFLLFVPLVLDVLLGLNWNAWRYFAVAIVILLVAAKPAHIGTALLGGALMGAQAAVSWEYGLAGLLSVLSIYIAAMFVGARSVKALSGGLFAVTAVGGWLAISGAITGNAFGDYIEQTIVVSQTASAGGLGQFAFRWSGHSLALFLLLAAAVLLGGMGLSRLLKDEATPADLRLIGGLAFALIVLKIGLQRADYLHLAVPFVPLILMVLVGGETRLFRGPRYLRPVMFGAIAAASVAHLVGHIPYGSALVERSARGWFHEQTGRPTVAEIVSRKPSILVEQSSANPLLTDLAEKLVAPEFATRPVLFYAGIWARGHNAGVCTAGYSFYDILYSDELAPLRQMAEETPDLIVVMRDRDYARLFEGIDEAAPPAPLSGIRKVASYTTSGHFSQRALENGIEDAMWRKAIGDYVVGHFHEIDRLHDMVFLERKP